MTYIEHTVGALMLDEDGEVARAGPAFERVLSDALDPAESLELIRRFSGGNGDSCVEVAFLPGAVAVRDTKDRALPPHRHAASCWTVFLAAVRSGEFDRS